MKKNDKVIELDGLKVNRCIDSCRELCDRQNSVSNQLDILLKIVINKLLDEALDETNSDKQCDIIEYVSDKQNKIYVARNMFTDLVLSEIGKMQDYLDSLKEE